MRDSSRNGAYTDGARDGGVALLLEPALVEPGVVVIRLIGECDLAEAPRLGEAIAAACDSAREIHLDLAGLEFLDSTGLKVLYQATRELEARGCRLVLVSPTQGVRRIFEIAQLDDRFEFADGLPAAASQNGALRLT